MTTAAERKDREHIDLDEIAAGLRPLLEREERSRWEIGDYLIARNGLTPGQMKTLARKVNREPSTLESYKRVATCFLESRRRYDLAWGVFKHLARVDSEADQDGFLRDKPLATANQAEKFANAWLAKQRNSRGPRQKYTDRAVVPGVEADLEVSGAALSFGQVVLTGDIETAELVFVKAQNRWRVDFTLKSVPVDE